jgi:hypothetical protein
VTGSRAWPDPEKVFHELGLLFAGKGPFELIHGACSTGADAAAHHWFEVAGQHLGVSEVTYPADWQTHGRAAGPMRNALMVKGGADLVLAFPLPGGRGTQGTIALALQAGIEVKEIAP